MAGSQMSKANQRQSGRRKAGYTAQFNRTAMNKVRRAWRTLRRFPLDAGALAVLQRSDRTTLSRAGLPTNAPEMAHSTAAATRKAA